MSGCAEQIIWAAASEKSQTLNEAGMRREALWEDSAWPVLLGFAHWSVWLPKDCVLIQCRLYFLRWPDSFVLVNARAARASHHYQGSTQMIQPSCTLLCKCLMGAKNRPCRVRSHQLLRQQLLRQHQLLRRATWDPPFRQSAAVAVAQKQDHGQLDGPLVPYP